MAKLIQSLGDAAAILGVLICIAAGLGRIAHTFSLAGIDVGTLFELGIGLMVFACLAKVQKLLENQKTGTSKER
jgi:hypothetical protein